MRLSYRTTTWGVACAAAGGVALLGLAACSGGGGSTSAGGGHTAAPTPSTTAHPTATVTPTPAGTGRSAGSSGNAAPGVGTCTTDQLRVTIGQRNGAMGSAQVQVVFTNTGDGSCVTAGYPGVSFVTGDRGRQVGSPAKRQGGSHPTVTLAPGDTAHATFRYPQVGNFPTDTCKPTTVRGLRVYPPDQQAAVFVSLPVRACSAQGAGVPDITAMRPGSGTRH